MSMRKSHRYLGGAEALITAATEDRLELEEAEVWSTGDIIETKKHAAYCYHPARKLLRRGPDIDRVHVGPRSLPVRIPEWGRRAEEENDRIPPHEYLARNRGASFSVQEGVGRTLKGRDLSRVRNAIWKQIGFED